MTKTTSSFILAAMAASAFLLAPQTAKAEAGDWLMRARAINVAPDEDSTVNIGGKVDVSNQVVPEIDFTYFLTNNIAAELILATALHELDHSGGANLGEAWILPPTLTLQYHFTPEASFSPYVGAGVNYSMFYGEDSGAGFTDLEVEGGFGYAFQGGFDYWLNDKWGINADIKKIYLNIDAELNNGGVRADVDLDPWIFGAGASYRF